MRRTKSRLTPTQQVDKAVADYQQSLSDEARGAEAQDARALVQGLLAGSALQLISASNAMGMTDVEIEKDEDGIYEHHFVITMRSGHRLKVTVEVI